MAMMLERGSHVDHTTIYHSRAPRRWNGVNGMTLIKPRESAELEKSTESAVEGEIREFVRRDVATLRRTPEAESEAVANNIGTLLQRVAGSSVQEIDRLMGELHTLRELLQSEGLLKSLQGRGTFVTKAIEKAYATGKGREPLDHFYRHRIEPPARGIHEVPQHGMHPAAEPAPH